MKLLYVRFPNDQRFDSRNNSQKTLALCTSPARNGTPTGTLSPLDSFAGELGIDFPHRLEAPHVINVRKQCLVTSIGYFGGVSLNAR